MSDVLTNPTPRLSYAFASRTGIIACLGEGDAPTLFHRPGVSFDALLEAFRVCGALPVQPVEPEAFNELVSKVYQSSARQAADLAADTNTDLASLADDAAAVEDILDESNDAPVVKLINALLSEAIRAKASDLHLEPYENRLVIRFRVDGVLRDMLEPKRSLAPMLVSRIKVMAGLDIAEKRKPHDGRVSLRVAGHDVDVRVSTIPSQYGERVVLRLLDRSSAKFNLGELGMSARSWVGRATASQSKRHYPRHRSDGFGKDDNALFCNHTPQRPQAQHHDD